MGGAGRGDSLFQKIPLDLKRPGMQVLEILCYFAFTADLIGSLMNKKQVNCKFPLAFCWVGYLS